MTSTSHSEDDEFEGDPAVPTEVVEGIDDIAEGATADGEDLDESLGL